MSNKVSLAELNEDQQEILGLYTGQLRQIAMTGESMALAPDLLKDYCVFLDKNVEGGNTHADTWLTTIFTAAGQDSSDRRFQCFVERYATTAKAAQKDAEAVHAPIKTPQCVEIENTSGLNEDQFQILQIRLDRVRNILGGHEHLHFLPHAYKDFVASCSKFLPPLEAKGVVRMVFSSVAECYGYALGTQKIAGFVQAYEETVALQVARRQTKKMTQNETRLTAAIREAAQPFLVKC